MSLSDDLFRSYEDLRWHLDPAAATLAGVPGYDGRLGRFDTDGVGEHVAAFRAIEAGIEELAIDDAADEIDRTALLEDVRVTIFRLQHERPQERNPAFWLLHLCEALWGLAARDNGARAPGSVALARLQAVPEYLAQAAATLREPPVALADIARVLTGPVTDLVAQMVRDASSSPELLAAAANAEAAIARFRLTLDTDLTPHVGEHAVAVGPEQFERLLHHQHAVTATAPEIWRSLRRLEEETEDALRGLGREAGGVWRDLLARRIRGAATAPSIDAAAGAELARIAGFLGGQAIIRGAPDDLVIRPLPAWLVPVTAHAAYLSPRRDPAGPARLLVADRPATRAFLSPVMAEFALPGIHLQRRAAEALEHEVRRHLASTLLQGGWGLYALEVVDEAGYWADPADRLVARAHLLFRILLARADIGLHTHQLTVDDARDMLTEGLPIDGDTAQAAVRTACLAPTQATGAIVGRRELLRLRSDAERRAGAGFDLWAHHEAVLGYGGLPAPLVRWGMGLDE